DYAVKLLEALDWTGLAMVEFKVGADGVRLMEINGRIWGSLPLAVRSGVDFPAMLAELWLGAGALPMRSAECGVRNTEQPVSTPHSAFRIPHSDGSCRIGVRA